MKFVEGRTEQEWKQLLDNYKAMEVALSLGKQYVALSTGGKSFTRISLTPEQIQAEISKCFRYLTILNPKVWGKARDSTYANFSSYQPH
jgi:hypothetical protein